MRKNLFLTSFILLFILFSVSAVSAADFNSTKSESIAINAFDYYVDLGGDDNNLGVENSPFNTIQKAISSSGHQDEVTIHLGEGIFKGNGNTMITINKAHMSQGGSITIQGAGSDKTIIDGTGQYYIFDIKSDCKIILRDLSIINCKSLDGGAVVNNGKLTIINCIFKDNAAVNSGGAIYSTQSATLNIYNSVFEGNTACRSGGAIYSYKSDLLIDNNEFISNKVEDDSHYSLYGGAVYIRDYYFNIPSISNTRFINNSVISHHWRESGSLYGGSLYMERCDLNNVSFINSKIEGIGANGGSYYSPSSYINIIKNILRINSTVNGVMENNIYPSGYNGQYSATEVYYVSPDGSDEYGDGSMEKPFATIAHVIEISNGKVYNLEINLLDGVYKGLGNTNLTVPDSLNLRIRGLNNGKVMIDGENVNFFMEFLNSFSGFKHEIANITFCNMKCQIGGYGKDDNKGIIHTFADLTISDCLFIDNNGLILSCLDKSVVSIVGTKFLNNSGENLFSYDSYVKFVNCLINNTKNIDRYLFISEQHNIADTSIIFENSTISNNNAVGRNERCIFDISASKLVISNSKIYNNKGIMFSLRENPNINIISSIFDSNIQSEIISSIGVWNVEKSNFTNNDMLLFNSPNSYKSVFNKILLYNNKKVIFNGENIVISNSAIYDNIQIGSVNNNLDYNYWGNNPSKGDYWITKTIRSENLFNGSYKISLSYELNNGNYHDINDIPILPEEFALASTNNQINPKKGVLTKEGFEAIGDFNGNDQKVVVTFSDNSKLELDVLNQHKSEINIKLSSNIVDIGDNLIIEIDVIDVKNGKKIDEGVLNIYLNGQLIESFRVNGDTLVKYIKVSGNKCLNNITVKYFGSSNYDASSAEEMFMISSLPLNTEIISQDLTKYYKNGSRFEIKLIDGFGNGLANKKVIFIINNNVYERYTDANGIAGLNINLDPGTYSVTTYFEGDSSLDNCSASNSINVLSTLNGNNIIKMFRNGTQYYIEVLDDMGNPLANVNVTMNINGVFYKRLTNGSGIAKLTINLNPGEYILTAYHPLTGLQKSNLITVNGRLDAENLAMFYRDGSSFEVMLFDEKGNPLADEKVTFNINGVFYTRFTDSNGIAKLAINLRPKDYIITASYGDSKLSKTIHIDPMVVQILSSTPAIHRGDYYSVQFKDAVGNPIVNEDVAMIVNNVRYIAKTDKDGIASLKLNVSPGVYTIESGLISNCYVSKSIYASVVVAK